MGKKPVHSTSKTKRAHPGLRPETGRWGMKQFEILKHVDLGDFIGVRGTMFSPPRAAKISVKLASFCILGKAIAGLRPPSGHGLERHRNPFNRQRYLDSDGETTR